MTQGRSQQAFVAAMFVALALLPALGGAFAIDLVTKIMVYAIVALSLELLVGGTGLVCFGQAAFFGVGAYAVVRLSPSGAAGSLPGLLAASIGAAAVLALAVGALSLRTRGIYFIMVTLAFAQMAYYLAHDTPLGGGSDGIYLDLRPRLPAWAGAPLARAFNLEHAQPMYFFALAALVGVFGALALLRRSRFGRALSGIRSNEQRMRAAGFSTYPYKLAAFTVSGGIAGLAGFLFAVKDGFVNPELLAWHTSGSVLVMIILGGLGHLRGALLGAFAFALLQEFFKSEAVFGGFARHWALGLGLTIIVSVAWLPRGLVGLPAQWRAWRQAGARRTAVGAAAAVETAAEATGEPV